MKPKKILKDLRVKHGLSQDAMAERLFVTRQAVSRWETGKTVPNIETLRLISKEFGVSINTLLGDTERLHCQACGMPMGDTDIARERHGEFNEKYCRWCWSWEEEKYIGPDNMEAMIEIVAPHMGMPLDAAREFLRKQLPRLEHWRERGDTP